ncbi:MAG: ribonuclease HII [Nanoarchaeota archaeon]|nr:ribonuclease HII [Nanoarchaeota archaeon]
MTTILGIDEAGRGSVIGPMVIAGLMIDEKDEFKLREIGVKDSKLLTKVQREFMFDKIKNIAKDYVILSVSAKEIDELRKTINLNKIEGHKMAEILKTLKADKAYIDTPQVSTGKFKDFLFSISKTKTKMICENGADLKYPVCSAASILAKVTRDREIEVIKKKVGFDFGVGYSHDKKSIEFVQKCLKEKKNLEYLRHSWITVSELVKEKEQKRLGDF